MTEERIAILEQAGFQWDGKLSVQRAHGINVPPVERRQRCEEQEEEEEEGQEQQGMQSQAQAHSCWPPTSAQLSSHLYDYCTTHNDNNNHGNDGTTTATTAPTPTPAGYERTVEHLARISRDDPTLPPLHYARFLACLRNGERIGAVESLHRYFDYAVIAGRREAVGRLLDYNGDGAGAAGSGGAGGNDARQQQQQRQQQQGGANSGAAAGGGADPADPLKPLSRYAPLLLTMLHHSHGQHGLARKAAEEAIRVGQQCSDSGAVTLALGWLALLDQELGGGGGGGGGHNAASGNAGDAVGGNAGGASASEQLWTLARTRATRPRGPPRAARAA